MLEDVAAVDNSQTRLLENRIEFVLKVNDEAVWTGLDLTIQFSKIFQQFPNDEITMSWRSSPVVWI